MRFVAILGWVVVAGCSAPPSSADAGIDAGPHDASTNDATAGDAGSDDAAIDAGMPDAAIDAGMPDAAIDAGMPDAAIDAGAPDAAIDAGAPTLGTLVVRDALAYDVVVDEGTVYWSGGLGPPSALVYGVFAVPLAGGAVRIVATSAQAAHGLVADADTLYFLDGAIAEATPGSLRAVPKAGGTVVTLAADEASPQGLVLDGTTLYWTTRATVRTVDVSGGTAHDVVSLSGAAALAVDPATHTLVVATDLGVVALPPAGAAMRTLSTDFADEVAVTGTDVVYGTHLGEFFRVPLDASAAAVALTSGAQFEGDLATDGTDVYWADGGVFGDFSGTVRRVPLAGGTTVVLPGAAEHLEMPLTRMALTADRAWVGVVGSTVRFSSDLVYVSR